MEPLGFNGLAIFMTVLLIGGTCTRESSNRKMDCQSMLAETAKDHLLVYLDRKKPANFSEQEPTNLEVSG